MANTDYGAIPLTLAEGVSQKLNQKLGVSTGFKPSEWADAINLLGRLPNKTVSGSICHFTDGVNVPLVNGKFGITAYQDGTGTPTPTNVRHIHGYSNMGVTRTGKNLLPPLASSFEANGIKWDLNADGSIRVHGTATGASTYDFGKGTLSLKIGSYFTNETGNSVNVVVYKNTSPASIIKSGGGAFNITEDNTPIFVRFNVANGTTLDTTIYPQLEMGSSATAYSSYKGQSFEVALGDTIYGGVIDKDGNGLITWRYVSVTSFNYFATATLRLPCRILLPQAGVGTTNQLAIACSIAETEASSEGTATSQNKVTIRQASGAPATLYAWLFLPLDIASTPEEANEWIADNPFEIIYELAEPIPFTLSELPTINILEGENNIWNTCGDSEMTYIASSAKTGINFSADVNSGWSATDATRTMMTITASGDAQIIFGKGATGITNCSNNHAYMKLIKNSTEIWTKTLPQNTTTKLDDIPDISLSDGDQLKLVFGYASTHSNVNMHFNNGYLQIAGNADVKGLAGVSNTYFSLIGFS